jgi:5-methylcytosine-specific restriction endonuclease McrA
MDLAEAVAWIATVRFTDSATNDFKFVVGERVFAMYGRTCACGAPATDVDHVVPTIVGGSDSLENLRPSCARCNRGRRD